FSLLTLDNQSLFDYDDDEGVEDKVIFEDDDTVLAIQKMEVGGAAIHVRP
ncbi:MAG: hypothetical protein HY582_00920, partial [Candidatus Omnitrophica bacterium]|nr:hypothetical protein [Candidatus Omnitrophota bacterium]